MQASPRLELRQSQQLVMTPRLQQAIRLLQMSRLEALDFIATEIEKNPILKLDEGGDEAPLKEPPESPERVDRAMAREDHDASESLGAQHENLYEGASGTSLSGGGKGRDGGLGIAGGRNLEEFTGEAVSLRDHLLPQIAASAKSGEVGLLASMLVDELDEAGYLRADLELLSERLGARSGLVAEAVTLLQSCEPTGIGARDLPECLALQLKEKNRFDPAMAALLDNLPDLATAKMDRLRAKCGVDEEDMREMIAELRALDPRPGAVFTGSLAQVVMPDVFIRRSPAAGWVVELNADAMPKVLLDRSYLIELDATAGEETRSFVSGCRQDADWLIRALDQRAQTILKVATEILRRQTGFFENGVTALEPMTLKQVAEEIGMHRSTVSRVTANKFLSCGRGLFEMKFFFTQALTAADGSESVSAAAVRHKIRSLIDNEQNGEVLSDDRIVTLLKQSGVDVARRTVAKYRNAMNIPSSAQRKRMKTTTLGC